MTGCHQKSGALILYATIDDHSKTIAILDPSNSAETLTLLDENLQDARGPVWSHSRGNILYAVEDEGNMYSLWLATAEGTHPRRLTDVFPFYAGVNGEWSFDDRYVAFRTSANRYALSTFSLSIREVAKASKSRDLMTSVWTYAWSPTDNRIAVMRWDAVAESSGLYILEIDGSQDTFISASTFPRVKPTSTNLSWSPDGRMVAITGFPDEVSPLTGVLTQVEEVYFVDLETNEIQQATEQQANFAERRLSCLNWSPDASRLFFVADYEALNGQTRQGTLTVVDLESETETQLAHYVKSWACPVWSPSGDEIAFVSVDNPQNVYGDIYIVNIEADTIRRLTSNQLPKYDLSW